MHLGSGPKLGWSDGSSLGKAEEEALGQERVNLKVIDSYDSFVYYLILMWSTYK